MLAPAGKYRKFVSLVMGFILLSLMIAPLARFGGVAPVTDWFAGLGYQNADSWESSYQHWRDTYLRGAFEEQLTNQLTNLLTQNGFTVHSTQITFASDFTQLTSVTVNVSRQETPQRVPFIRIQPVQVGREQARETCPTATTAKNLISEFYNLSTAHIHVIVT